MEKTQTGIKGFDKLVEGGFPKGAVILLSGTPATGKTIFALEYLFNGATKFNENGLYVTFEEKTENLKNQAMQFGWDLQKLEKEGKIKLLYIPSTEISKNTLKELLDSVRKNNFERLVIDSLSTLAINTPIIHSINEIADIAIKRFIYSFVNDLRKLDDTTTLLISQTVNESSFSKDCVSEFICDGIIHILFESMGGEFSRSLIVRKMRRTDNDEDIHPLEITSKGLVIHTIK